MCNPRKIRVRASRRLAEAWQTEIARTAQVTETLTGEAHVIQPFGASLAEPVRVRFAELLAADPAWQETGEGYRYQLPNGYLLYRPETGELEITANVSGEITGEATAVRAATGVAEGAADAEVEERYYGSQRKMAEIRGKQAAEQAAEERARTELTASKAQRVAEAQRALEEAGDEVEQEARDQAQQAITDRRDERQRELDAAADRRAAQMNDEYLRVVNQLLAHAYRDVLLERARHSDAGNLFYEENDGVIDIQFEIS
jgi:hypothetical protein